MSREGENLHLAATRLQDDISMGKVNAREKLVIRTSRRVYWSDNEPFQMYDISHVMPSNVSIRSQVGHFFQVGSALKPEYWIITDYCVE